MENSSLPVQRKIRLALELRIDAAQMRMERAVASNNFAASTNEMKILNILKSGRTMVDMLPTEEMQVQATANALAAAKQQWEVMPTTTTDATDAGRS